MTSPDVQPPKPVIKRSRLADQVYDWLKERILSRQLLPGARLSVPAIADELELSRSPVREAVQRIVQEGLATERPHQGAVVASADLRSLVELYEVRAVLEGLSAHLAATTGALPPDDLAAIIREHQEAVDAHDEAAVIRADRRFHDRILSAAANPELERILSPVLQRMTLAMLAREPSWPAKALREHRAVADAIGAGDPEAARDRMTEHIQRVRRDLMDKAEQSADSP